MHSNAVFYSTHNKILVHCDSLQNHILPATVLADVQVHSGSIPTYSLVQDSTSKPLNSRVVTFVEKSLVTLKVINYSSRGNCQKWHGKLFAGNLVVAKWCFILILFQARNTNSCNCSQHTSMRGRSEGQEFSSLIFLFTPQALTLSQGLSHGLNLISCIFL